MWKFIFKILFLLIAIFIPLCIADSILTHHYRSKNYYPFSTWTNIIEGNLNSDTWILGSSRAWLQYNPRILDSILDISSYNMGCNAQFIYLDLQCYKIARAFNPKPKYILLDLAWPSLTMDEAPISRYFYMPYINEKAVRKIVKKNRNTTPFYLYVPCYRFLAEYKSNEWYENDVAPEYKGYKAKQYKWNGLEMDNLDYVNYKCEPEAIAVLNSFLMDCKNNSISVILVHSPFYYKGFEKIHNNKKMLTLFQDIADHNNVPFLDYTNSPFCYDTLNFYNAMHLNAHGADLFSAKLAHDLDSLGLIPSRK